MVTNASDEQSDEVPDSSQRRKRIAGREGWKKSETYIRHIERGLPSVLANSNPEPITITPMQVIDKIFTFELFEHLKEKFELYASRDMNSAGFSTSIDEVHKFVGILLLSGYHHW
jgi:hypothetical protein